jgi:hypothetical protein
MPKSRRPKVAEEIMRDLEAVKILSEEDYWRRMHRLRCQSLYRQEGVMVSNKMPENTDLYYEIVSIGNRAANAIDRHERMFAVRELGRQPDASDDNVICGYELPLPVPEGEIVEA